MSYSYGKVYFYPPRFNYVKGILLVKNVTGELTSIHLKALSAKENNSRYFNYIHFRIHYYRFN